MSRWLNFSAVRCASMAAAVAALLCSACGGADRGEPAAVTAPAARPQIQALAPGADGTTNANEVAAPRLPRAKPQASGAGAHIVQVCPGPALPPTNCFNVDTSVIGGIPQESYVVKKTGSLLFDIDRRRTELATLSPALADDYCIANPAAANKAGLPTIAFQSGIVHVFETALGGGVTRQSADMEFTGLTTSDGLSLPKFGFIWNVQRGTTRLSLQFRPSIDPNVAGVPGLDTDIAFDVDIASRDVSFPRLTQLPAPVRRLLMATAYRLPGLYTASTSLEVRPGATLPLWNMQEIVQNATAFSSIGFDTTPVVYAPIKTLTCDLSPGGQTCTEGPDLIKFRDYMVRTGAEYTRTGGTELTQGLLSNLRAWAGADALTSYPGIVVGASDQPDFRPKYELLWFLMPVLETWSLVRDDPLVAAQDRVAIEAWIGKLVAYATEPFGGPQYDQNPFNTGYLSVGTKMAWGVMHGDNKAFQAGIERIYMGLHQMRSDGSFPREVARGACALRYQDTMLLNLMQMAEVAREQGYDPYSFSVDGKTLHTAVKFLLDAIDDPTAVLAYSQEDAGNCAHSVESPLELSTVRGVSGGMNYSAWLEPYLARFPSHPNAPRVANIVQGGIAANRPIFHPHSGGNTSCFSAGAKPEPPTVQVDCVFDWAANTVPYLLAPSGGKSSSIGPYFYRAFTETHSYLGLSAIDQHVYFLGAGTPLVDLGPVAPWLVTSSCK